MSGLYAYVPWTDLGADTAWVSDGSTAPHALHVTELAEAVDACRGGMPLRLVAELRPADARWLPQLASRLGADLLLGSPFLMAPALLDGLPAAVLLRMRTFDRLPACLGGWREWSATDCVTLQLSAAVRTAGTTDEALLSLLARHPAWPALSYLGRFNIAAAAAVVAWVRDPRWLVDPAQPDRLRRYYAALGLRPRIFSQILGQQRLGGSELASAAINLLGTWAAEGCVNDNFLWRMLGRVGYDQRGYLAVSRCFAKFLRSVWLHEESHRNGVGKDLFVPELFFRTPEDAQNYRQNRVYC